LTYGFQGTSKAGVRSRDHAIIYTDKDGKAPKELASEEKLVKKPIRVVPLTSRYALVAESRLNYAKVYTLEYNVRVCFIGQIHDKSIKHFNREYNITHQSLPEDQISFGDEED
jgi:hypothetical protein